MPLNSFSSLRKRSSKRLVLRTVLYPFPIRANFIDIKMLAWLAGRIPLDHASLLRHLKWFERLQELTRTSTSCALSAGASGTHLLSVGGFPLGANKIDVRTAISSPWFRRGLREGANTCRGGKKGIFKIPTKQSAIKRRRVFCFFLQLFLSKRKSWRN